MDTETRDKQLKDILQYDFEELTKGQIQVLRNRTREMYGIEGTERIPEKDTLYTYLIEKRRLIDELETVDVHPRRTKISGAFVNGEKLGNTKVTVTTFDGRYGLKEGSFVINVVYPLPVLTVSFVDDYIELIGLAPDGHFCLISSRCFDFEI